MFVSFGGWHVLVNSDAEKTRRKAMLCVFGRGLKLTLCYATMLRSQKSSFRAGFRPDSNRTNIKFGPSGRPKAGRRADFETHRIESDRNPARKPDFRRIAKNNKKRTRQIGGRSQAMLCVFGRASNLLYVTQRCFRAGDRASGPNFGLIPNGKASNSALRPAEGRQEPN